MTDIPGTGKLKTQEEKVQPPPVETSVVNVKEIKKPKRKPDEDDKKWFNKLSYWGLFGGAASIIFILLGIVNIRFLYLAPFPFIAAVVSWYIRRLVKRIGKDQDAIFK